MSHMPGVPSSSEDSKSNATNTPSTAPIPAHQLEISRRGAIKALMAAAGAAVLFGVPRRAFAASATQETLDALASAEEQLDAVQAQLDILGAEFEALSVKQDETISQIEAVQVEIDATQVKIEEKQAELEAKQKVLAGRVSDSYKNGPTSVLNLLLSSESFDELLSNSRYVDKINEADRAIIKDVQTIRDELEQQKASLEAQKASLEGLKSQQEAQLSGMRDKQAEIRGVLDGLSQDVKDLIAKRDAEYLAAVEEEERQRKAAEEANRNNGGGTISGGPQSLERVLSSCRATPTPGAGLCALWVSQVFYNAGFSYASGNANDMYNWWCTTSNRDSLKAGMIVAVSSHPHTSAGMVWGHVGVYMGNGTVMDNIGYIRSIGLSDWLSYYGATVTPRWGWFNGWILQ